MIRNLFVLILPLVLLLGCTATVITPQQSKNESISQPAELTKPGVRQPIPSDNIALTKDEPDLIITDIWVEGNIIYFKVKNAGIVPAIPTYSCLYVENVMPPEATSYVESLMPGDERTLYFARYTFAGAPYSPHIYPAMASTDGGLNISYVKTTVCSDCKNESQESDETNNCLVKLWGNLMDYDLLYYLKVSNSVNSQGEEPALCEGSPSGGIVKNSDGAVEMIPDQVPNGAIETYHELPGWGVGRLGLPASVHFISKIGLSDRAIGSDGVTFQLRLIDKENRIILLLGQKMTVPGEFQYWDINLSGYEGQEIRFLLRVEGGHSPTNDYAIWQEARLVQIN